MEKISVVIPVYDHVQALKQSLASLDVQTYKNIEVIVVDDGSDDSKEVEKVCENANTEVVYISQENQGAPAARNNGLSRAKGKFVIFWDADVVAELDMLKKLKDALDANPEVSFSYCNYFHGSFNMPGREFEEEALREINYIHSTSLIRRSHAVKWDESLRRFQDWDLWLTMTEKGRRGVWVNEYLFRVIPRKSGMSEWLPSFMYQRPWRWLPGVHARVRKYEKARDIVLGKHV